MESKYSNPKYILSTAGWSSKDFDGLRHAALEEAITTHGKISVTAALNSVASDWALREPHIAATCKEDIKWVKTFKIKRTPRNKLSKAHEKTKRKVWVHRMINREQHRLYN